MSLSRILNDEPMPTVHSSREYSSATIPPEISHQEKSPASNSGHFSPPNMPLDRVGDLFRASSYYDSAPREQTLYIRELNVNLFFNSGGNHFHTEHNGRRPMSPDGGHEILPYHELNDDTLPRKRRRGGHADSEHQASVTRRVN